MVMGITYEGEIGRVGAGSTPQETVELICTDPRFVEAASAKKPNFIMRLFNGALSFPRDWWYGTTFLATRSGILGSEGKTATDAAANTLSELLAYANTNRMMAFKTIRAVLGHLIHYPEFWSRTALQLGVSGATTAFAGPTAGLAVGSLNFILATTGAVVRAVDNGATSFAEVVVAAGLGYSDPQVAQMVALELSLPEPENGNYDIPDEREEFLLEVLRGVLRCIRNPNEYMNSDERRAVVVPVGQVSSARPRGVMGNIPIGYETNALDAIAEDAAIFRGGGGGSW